MRYHLYVNIYYQALDVSSAAGLPQLAKTSIATSVKKWKAVWLIALFSGISGKFICSSRFALSSFLKINAIANQIITEKLTAPIVLATPISKPRILAVSIIESMLMAGPE